MAEVYKNKKLIKFYQENELFFENLENAYFTSRYFPKKFSENGVKLLLEKGKEFLKLLEKLFKEKFL